MVWFFTIKIIIDKKEKIYKYVPIITKEQLEKSIVHNVIGELLKKFEKSTISYLSEELSDNDKDIEKIKHKLDELKKNEWSYYNYFLINNIHIHRLYNFTNYDEMV